jgi:glucose-1-phosphate thymidylyltransferase
VVEFARNLKPYARGELEIADLNRLYMKADDLYVEQMGRGYAWLATGTNDSLPKASEFVRTLQHRQGIQIACLDETACGQDFISANEARGRRRMFKKTAYEQVILKAERPPDQQNTS